MRTLLIIGVLLLVAGLLTACGEDGQDAGSDPAPRPQDQTEGSSGRPEPDGEPVRAEGDFEVETVATGLSVPWDLTFLPGGEALVTERPGRIRVLEADGELRQRSVAEVDVVARGEGGLLGIDADPDFADGKRFVYLVATTPEGNQLQRWNVDDDLELGFDEVVLDGIPGAGIHNAGRVRFGPDGRLYLPTGDAAEPQLAQDRDSLAGKFLRLTPEQYRDSTEDPEMLSLGHRNPQGFDWQPESGRLVATEHGAQRNDEVNVIREGRNYGWPLVEGREHGSFEAPAQVYEDTTIAPSGATFVSEPGSQWTGDFLMAGLRSQQLRRLSFEGTDVVGDEPVVDGEFGRLRAVVEGPDGALYLTTSNRDGRGSPDSEDDRILRVTPPAG